jgi:hypothetical protein
MGRVGAWSGPNALPMSLSPLAFLHLLHYFGLYCADSE